MTSTACGWPRPRETSSASPSVGCVATWFLAELFVAPGHQGRGAGNELLARTFAHGLITFTFNVVSQGLYIQHGLFPRLPIYVVSVARDLLMSCLQGDKLRCMASHLKTLVHLDVSTRQNRTICRSIIEAHHGRLWVIPNVCRGAIFQFYCLVIPNTRGCRNKSWAEVKLATTAVTQK